jgi:methanogenic corrinoid protein MtbC1
VIENSAGAEDSPKKEAVGSAARLSRLYLEALRAGDGPGAYRIASRALREGMGVPRLYQRVVAPAMHEIGKLWEAGALTVADEHLATALTNRVLSALRPPFRVDTGEAGTPTRGRVMLAAVEGEQHALGLRMASDILEDAGFQTIYLGADVPTDALLQAVRSLSPDLLALTATMSVLAPRLEEVSSSVRQAHPRIKLLIGGQAASPRVAGGTLVQSFELLPGRVLRPQV